jgi:transcriptional regulator with XRE-family HTH domain
MKNQKSVLREPTHEMFTDRSPTTRALPRMFRRLRERLGLSPNQFAILAKVSRPMLCRVEKERSVPSPEIIARVAQACGLSMIQFYVLMARWFARQPACCRACKYVCMVRGDLIWLDAHRQCTRLQKASPVQPAISPVC